MSDGSAFQGQPVYVEKSSNKKRLVIIFLVIFLLVIAALGALYMLGSSSKHTNQPTNPIPTDIMAATPTTASNSAQLSVTTTASSSPTNSPKILQISVLNGSGTPGAAGQIASALQTAGYTNVTTGNAKSFTYTGVTLYAKNAADLKQVQKVITATNATVKITASINSTIPTDVEVIVGK
ncbi:MAG TPA: LytR C-terminal domain-containing protein [Candidatus Sulfotelmatobacter sp.]|jgi:flagellar basal body-associated protein FliL|nr:LytR C-terminal domain-containing protein [Candidatus Sulfotelmatobacter sp.]